MTPAEEARWIVRDRMHDVRVWLGEVEEHQPRHAPGVAVMDIHIDFGGFHDGMAAAGLRQLPPAARRFNDAMQRIETILKETQ